MPSDRKASTPDESEKYQVVAEVAASANFIYQGTRLKYANPAAERLTGYDRGELLKMSFLQLFPKDEHKILRNLGRKLQLGETSGLHSELRLIKKGGEVCWIDLVATSVDYSGKPAMVWTAFDITNRKRGELLQDAVYRIAQASDRSGKLEDLFPAFHSIIAEVMPAKNFYIALKNPEDDLISYPYYCDELDLPALPHSPRSESTV